MIAGISASGHIAYLRRIYFGRREVRGDAGGGFMSAL